MVSILASLNNLIFEEVPVETVHGLLWTVVPTGVYPLSAVCVLPGTIDLGHNWLCEVVRVLYMHPVTNLPQFAIVNNAARHGNTSLFHDVVSVRPFLLGLCNLARLLLEMHSVLVDLAVLLIVLLCVFEHELHIHHKVIDRVVLLSLEFALENVHSHWVLDLGVVFRHDRLIGDAFECADHELVKLISRLPYGFHNRLDSRFHRCVDPRRAPTLLS